MAKTRIFVTDGSYRNSLAAVRALGASGFGITVGERAGVASIARWSRYCTEHFTYPDPQRDPRAAIDAILEHFATREYGAAIPVGLEMTALFETYRDRMTVPTMLPPASSFAVASDKGKTFEYAATTGIPIPKTVPAGRWREIGLPVVFKHPRTGASVAWSEDEAGAREREYGASHDGSIAQQYIPGENGYGYFGFFERGKETAYFMHERLMQFPREGGPSVVARSVRIDRLRYLGKALLESLNWHGPAMVEFKKSDRDGDFYLIEINPKLWGSLDLAIRAGANFPAWIANYLTRGESPSGAPYAEGTTYQWVMPIGIKTFLRYPGFRAEFVRNVLSRNVHTDLRWSDPVPALAELSFMARSAVAR